MNHSLLHILIAFISFITQLAAQTKPENYYNAESVKISKEEFYTKVRNSSHGYNYYELDDEIVRILYIRHQRGRLSPELFAYVKKELNKIQTVEEGVIVIVYFSGKDLCRQAPNKKRWSIFEKQFRKKMDRKVGANQYWIFKEEEHVNFYYPDKFKWTKDEKKVFEKVFFKGMYQCFSSTVIDQHGNFVSSFGDLQKETLLSDLRKVRRMKK